MSPPGGSTVVNLGSSLTAKSLKFLEACVPNTSNTCLFIRPNLGGKREKHPQADYRHSHFKKTQSGFILNISIIWCVEHTHTHTPALRQTQEELPVSGSQVLDFHHSLQNITVGMFQLYCGQIKCGSITQKMWCLQWGSRVVVFQCTTHWSQLGCSGHPHATRVRPGCECDTYGLETDGGGNGIQVRVCVGKVREASRLNALEVHGLKKKRNKDEWEHNRRCVFVSFPVMKKVEIKLKRCVTSISFVKRYMDIVVLL